MKARLTPMLAALALSMACAGVQVGEPRGRPLPQCVEGNRFRDFAWPADRPDTRARLVDDAPLVAELAPFSGSHIAQLHVGVGKDGFAGCVDVRRSSGDADFDLAAEWGLAQARFTPAQRDGVPVESIVHRTVKKVATTEADACFVEGIGAFCSSAADDVERAGDLAGARRLYRAACDGGDRLGCQELSRMLTHGRGGPADVAGALVAAARGCEAGLAHSCMLAGAAEHERDDVVAAAVWYQRACDRYDSEGCNRLAIYASQGRLAPADEGKALVLFRRACELGNLNACESASWRLFDGVGASASPFDAKGIAEKLCRRSEGRRCSTLASQLWHVDRPRALALLEKGCFAFDDVDGVETCVTASRLDEEHKARWLERLAPIAKPVCADDAQKCRYVVAAAIGLGQLEVDAATLIRIADACDKGSRQSCEAMGDWHVAVGEEPAAVPWFQRACDAGAGSGCVELGKRAPEQRAALERRACLLGNDDACDAVVVAAGRVDDARLVARFRRVCAVKPAASCRAVAEVERAAADGFGPARAAALWRRACDAADAVSCRALAAAYRTGGGVSASTAKADELDARACALEPASCSAPAAAAP